MRRLFPILIALVMLAALTTRVAAQDVPESITLADVYITTQDNASLRAGPGTHWERIAVIPYDTTLRATGRTLDGQWIQVRYEGELLPGARTDVLVGDAAYGWIASWLLGWSGSVLELPIDGVPTIPFVRASTGYILAFPEMTLFTGAAGPQTPAAYPLEGIAYVEATGRLGQAASQGLYWVQIKMRGQYYWTSIIARGGQNLNYLPDASYLYTYGRIIQLLDRSYSSASAVLSDIRGRWSSLDRGQPVSCNHIPPDLQLDSFRPSDLASEPLFNAVVNAFSQAQAATNIALAAFRDVCATPSDSVPTQVIRDALNQTAIASNNLDVISLLYSPLRLRDPFLQ